MIVDDILLLAARECGRKIAGLCARVKKAETKQPYDTDVPSGRRCYAQS